MYCEWFTSVFTHKAINRPLLLVSNFAFLLVPAKVFAIAVIVLNPGGGFALEKF